MLSRITLQRLKVHLGLRVPAEYFERIYAASPDPWNYTSSDYESQKYAFTLNSLSRDHYSSALEIGCSIGVMTKQLAGRCDRLLSVDLVECAVQQARQRCASETHVEFAQMRVPEDWPKGSFDLIVISEVLSYLTAAELDALVVRLRHSLAFAGEIILVHHWRGRMRWLSETNRRHGRLIALVRDFARVIRHESKKHYRLDLLHHV
ncbi:MAG: nodulation S family protein [Pseudomonadota bacterium]|nr:nodulation S family protein [Pseudomonadota bacterium]